MFVDMVQAKRNRWELNTQENNTGNLLFLLPSLSFNLIKKAERGFFTWEKSILARAKS